jgi:hypothetical protein
MRYIRKILPGRPGSKKWVREYGERLVCVRYRYDSDTGEKIKTIEIVFDRQKWVPGSVPPPSNKRVALRIAYEDTYLRKLVKCSGGKWDADHKVWLLPLSEVRALRLENRVAEIDI